MKIAKHYVASIAIALSFIAGCATGPVRTDRLDKVAIVTSGDTNVMALTRFGPVISIVEVDGKPVDRRYGPIELAPGAHSVTLKCGDSTKVNSVNALAGEVYQFAMVTAPGVKGCVGSLSRVRSAKPPIKTAADEQMAEAERGKAEYDRAVQLAREERAKATIAKAEPSAKPERTEAGAGLMLAQREVSDAIASWAAAWSRKDVAGYLAAYSKDFDVPRGRSRRQWEAERRSRIVGKSRIEVKIDALEITVDGNIAKARFRQSYRSNTYSENSSKTLTLVKTNQKWLIQQER